MKRLDRVMDRVWETLDACAEDRIWRRVGNRAWDHITDRNDGRIVGVTDTVGRINDHIGVKRQP